jgi:quinolinate synthase
MKDRNMINKINDLKKELNAVILVHNYQVEDVQLIADHLGDSLGLSRIAAQTKKDTIVFCGVKFMAETAKVLSPDKMVLLPRLDAGCPMADMITVEDLTRLKKQHPKAAIVTYVNSSVEIKAMSDICCTSSNALKVVKKIDNDEVIFIPDRNLGSYIQNQLPEKKLILFEGYCYVHNRIKKSEIEKMHERYPKAVIIAHPEVKTEIIELADEVFSTGGMINFTKKTRHKQLIIITEEGLLNRLRRECPDKEILSPYMSRVCSNMKRTSLKDVYLSLLHKRYQIKINNETIKKAKSAIDKMIKII